MRGLGTIINMLAVLAGSGIGIFLKNGLKPKTQEIMMQACGISAIFISITGTLQGMFTVTNGKLQTSGVMLLIFSLVIGSLIGQIIDIEKSLDTLGEKFKTIFKVKEDNRFAEGFVNASLITCVGAMTIVGAIQDGLKGDYSMLAAKSILDFVVTLTLASHYGVGVAFSTFSVVIIDGGITALSALIGPFLGQNLIGDLSYIGSALIFCVGINMIFGKKINVGNMLPALLIPIVFECISHIF